MDIHDYSFYAHFLAGANGPAAPQRGGEPERGAEDGLGVEAAGDQLRNQGEARHRRPPRAHGPSQRRLRPACVLKGEHPKLPVQDPNIQYIPSATLYLCSKSLLKLLNL